MFSLIIFHLNGTFQGKRRSLPTHKCNRLVQFSYKLIWVQVSCILAKCLFWMEHFKEKKDLHILRNPIQYRSPIFIQTDLTANINLSTKSLFKIVTRNIFEIRYTHTHIYIYIYSYIHLYYFFYSLFQKYFE
jgi:hypothetical protein